MDSLRNRMVCVVLAAFAVAATSVAHAAAPAYRFTDIDRVVAVGDVHGAFDRLASVLQGTGIIDDSLAWRGGTSHLVFTGDLVDRGDDGRKVLDLVMRLEAEASAAGGAVHVLLGNHEAMNLTGDLRYVSDGDFAQFGGALERRAAFAPDGEFGEWLLSKPVVIVIDDTAFVHGGLSPALAGMGLEAINANAARDLRRVAAGWHALLAAEALGDGDGFDALRTKVRELAARSVDGPLPELGRAIVAGLEGLPFTHDGPLWYRGSSLCHPYAEAGVLDTVLDGFGARRVVVGHTPTHDRRIATRIDGRVLRIDTGTNHQAYGGNASALVIEDGVARAFYPDAGFAAPVAEPNRVWDRPYGMDDAEMERFLATAEVTAIEDVGVGVTKPRLVTLEHDGRELRAIFGTVDTDPDLLRRRWSRESDYADRYVHNVAAYKVDRMLGLEIVPVSVVRTIDGEEGALTYWLEHTVNENERRERGLSIESDCDMRAQFNLMNVFDVLIFNVDRSLGNILYDTRTWDLWLVDHTRAFGAQRGIPDMVPGAEIDIPPALAAALARVERGNLDAVETLLHRRQVRALISRAEWLRRVR